MLTSKTMTESYNNWLISLMKELLKLEIQQRKDFSLWKEKLSRKIIFKDLRESDFERLLLRTLSEANYKKVKSFLEKEISNITSYGDFEVRNSNRTGGSSCKRSQSHDPY